MYVAMWFAWAVIFRHIVLKLWKGGKDVAKDNTLLCQLCGSDMLPTPKKIWVCKTCEAEYPRYYPSCLCGGRLNREIIDRWQCPDCGAEVQRGDPQWMIDKRLEAEDRARMRGMIRGGRSKSGRTRKKKYKKDPWQLSNYL